MLDCCPDLNTLLGAILLLGACPAKDPGEGGKNELRLCLLSCCCLYQGQGGTQEKVESHGQQSCPASKVPLNSLIDNPKQPLIGTR